MPARHEKTGRPFEIIGDVIEAVVFDLDGVLIESEQVWDEARREVAQGHHGRWLPSATEAMQGMSSVEWAAYMRRNLGVELVESQIVDAVVEKLLARYRRDLPLLPGAVEAVHRMGEEWPLGVASSSNRVVIDEVLDLARLAEEFEITVSSEEVPRGKPAPDVYLEAARRLARAPARCAAIEDSTNGIRSALAAEMFVLAVPNRDYPPASQVLANASARIESLDELTTDLIRGLSADRSAVEEQRLDEQELESFPASDPHADWAGP
jgi:HAD superfamily hydrolase (TIGR01509 family)